MAVDFYWTTSHNTCQDGPSHQKYFLHTYSVFNHILLGMVQLLSEAEVKDGHLYTEIHLC